MVEFNKEQISENELIEAANAIFTAQEKDFEKIKNEKWYKTLFHAITLNNDGKKYAVKGISSLAKLQQLFMTIYVKNYRESHNQLNDVIDAVKSNSEAIKKLYSACVLNLEEQTLLTSLDMFDAEILALFLGEYRNSDGEVPDDVRKYNRGVLTALNQHVPEGKLDNHQIRKLHNPRVVYRCFMEQCAIDNTIDTQEWTDKIYEDLKDFELSENSKIEIKESVKYEAEMAGVDYFIVKYSKDNAGVLDTDFEVDFESMGSGQKSEQQILIDQMHKTFDLARLSMAITEFDFLFLETLSGDGLDFMEPLISIEHILDDDIKDDISSGIIKSPALVKSIENSLSDECGFVHGFKFCTMDEDFNEHKEYFFITTVDGYFFFIDGKIAYADYDSVREVKQTSDSVTISAWRVLWFSEDGGELSGDDEIVIRSNSTNKKYLGALRKGIKKIIEVTGGYVESSDDKVEEIVEKYIKRIAKGASAVPYLVKEFGYDDEKKKKKLKNALAKYARKVREEEVIGFIDTTVFGNGGDGLLFSKYGIAFDWAFEKIFVRYEEINSMYIRKGKELVLCGNFKERKNDVSDPVIPNIYFDLETLKECLEEIKYEI